MSERLTMFTPDGYVECDPIDVWPNEYSPENFKKVIEKQRTIKCGEMMYF